MENAEKDISSYLELRDLFMKIYDEEEKKLPYHINLLDITGADENVHSRILTELLKKKCNNGKFELLESFLVYLNRHNKDYLNFNNDFQNPDITAEKDRIDILVCDDTRALIIENKICNAADQEWQLKRYIDKVKENISNKKKISVLYLVSEDEKRPTDQTWGPKEEEYEAEFKDRFMIVHYRIHILPWLKEFVLPECRTKDVYLRSAVEQYIDYLEGMFNLRKKDKAMTEKLQNVIKEQLKLSKQSEENLKTLDNELEKLDNIRVQMDLLRRREKQICWREWAKKINDNYNNDQYYKFLLYENQDEYSGVGVIFEYKEKKYEVMLFEEKNVLRYGIGKYNEIPKDMMSYVEALDLGLKEDGWWLAATTDFNDGLKKWETLMDSLKNLK